MTLRNRLTALERLTEDNKPAPPALIIRTGESEQEARQLYADMHGYPPPAGAPIITVVPCETGN